jgi:hypothetical protein
MEFDIVIKILTLISASIPVFAIIKYVSKKQKKEIVEILEKLEYNPASPKRNLINSEVFSIYFDVNAPINHINSIIESSDPIVTIKMYKKFSFMMKFNGKIQKADGYINKWNTQRDFSYFFATLIILFWLLMYSKILFINDKAEQVFVNILFIFFTIGIYFPVFRLIDIIFDLNHLDRFFADQDEFHAAQQNNLAQAFGGS